MGQPSSREQMNIVSFLSLLVTVVTCATQVWHDTAAAVTITHDNVTLPISGAVFAIGSPVLRVEGVLEVGADLCEPLEQPDLNGKVVLVKKNDECSTRAKCNIASFNNARAIIEPSNTGIVRRIDLRNVCSIVALSVNNATGLELAKFGGLLMTIEATEESSLMPGVISTVAMIAMPLLIGFCLYRLVRLLWECALRRY